MADPGPAPRPELTTRRIQIGDRIETHFDLATVCGKEFIRKEHYGRRPQTVVLVRFDRAGAFGSYLGREIRVYADDIAKVWRGKQLIFERPYSAPYTDS